MNGSTIGYIGAVLWALVIALFALLLAALPGPAHAGCIQGPATSANKSLHFIGTAGIAAIGTVYVNPWVGFGAAIGAGAAREIYKARTPGMACETSSMLYDLAGAGFGVWLGHRILIAPKPGGVAVSYATEF